MRRYWDGRQAAGLVLQGGAILGDTVMIWLVIYWWFCCEVMGCPTRCECCPQYTAVWSDGSAR